MNKLKELMSGSEDAPEMDEKRRMQIELLQDLKEMMGEMMGQGMMPESIEKVTVAAPDREGLEEGLDKASDMMEDMPEESDLEKLKKLKGM